MNKVSKKDSDMAYEAMNRRSGKEGTPVTCPECGADLSAHEYAPSKMDMEKPMKGQGKMKY